MAETRSNKSYIKVLYGWQIFSYRCIHAFPTVFEGITSFLLPSKLLFKKNVIRNGLESHRNCNWIEHMSCLFMLMVLIYWAHTMKKKT